MKKVKIQILLLAILLSNATSIQCMMGRYISPARFRMLSSRNISQASVKMPINEPINIPTQEPSGMQKRLYRSKEPRQQSFLEWIKSFFELKSANKQENSFSQESKQKDSFSQEIPIKEELPSDEVIRRNKMFAFMRNELKEAKKYFTRLTGTDLSRILNTLYEYEDVLNSEKDGHTILGEIISLYGFYLKTDISESPLFVPLHTICAGEVLNFFREVKKLGANHMTPNDIMEIEAIKEEFVSLVATRYKGAEELIPLKDILEMADVFSELKGDTFSFLSRFEKSIMKSIRLVLTSHSLIDSEYYYRKNYRGIESTNLYNQILKDALSSIFGSESDFYKKFIHKLQLLKSYTDDEIDEMIKMRDKIKKESVEKTQKQQEQARQQEREKNDEELREAGERLRQATEELRQATEELRQETEELRQGREELRQKVEELRQTAGQFKQQQYQEEQQRKQKEQYQQQTQESIYTFLGIPETSSDIEVKRAYFKFMKENHPDITKSLVKEKKITAADAKQWEEKVKKVNNAYEIYETNKQHKASARE